MVKECRSTGLIPGLGIMICMRKPHGVAKNNNKTKTKKCHCKLLKFNFLLLGCI